MTHTLSVGYARYGLWLLRSFGLTLLLALLLLSIKIADQPFTNTQRVEARANTTNSNSLSEAYASAQTRSARNEQIQRLITSFTESNDGTFGIVVEDVTHDETMQYGETNVMNSASLYKAFLVYYAFQQIDAGQLSLEQHLLNKTTVEKCLDIVITVSDNPCGVALQQRYGQAATDYFQSLNLKDTDLTGIHPQTSAQDVTRLFALLYRGYELSSTSQNAYLELLASQKVNPRLPANLPVNTKIMHKTGDLGNISHDAGIITTDQATYIVTVMTDWQDSAATKNSAVAELSRSIFELMNP